MPSTREIRRRIRSVGNMQQITRAMEMVSAAKMRKAQQRVTASRPYSEQLRQIMSDLASQQPDPEQLAQFPLLQKRPVRTVELIVVTPDRGLTGALNTNILRRGTRFILEETPPSSGGGETRAVQVIAVGKKARDQLKRITGDRMIATFDFSAHRNISIAAAEPVAELILREFAEGRADVVTLFYSRYKSVVSQVPTETRLIPAAVEAGVEPIDLGGAAYEYEPDEEEILATLLPRNITVQILSAMFENQAGFYAAQMSAMDNATRNAGDMISALTLQYNRSRQAQITKELIEIISGAEAL